MIDHLDRERIRAEYDGALYYVEELTDIAWPSVVLKCLGLGRMKLGLRPSVASGKVARSLSYQGQDVVLALAQRGYLDRDDGNGVVQIGSQGAVIARR